jgi:hypothetical protein
MINVPIAQSIRFRPVNTDLFNFDNTFSCSWFKQYLSRSDIKIQVITPDDGTLSFLHLIYGVTDVNISDCSTSFIGAYKYDTYTIQMSGYYGVECYLDVYSQEPPDSQVLSYRSEPFTILDQPEFLVLNWFNTESDFARIIRLS